MIERVVDREESLRQLIELAVSYGRKQQSVQTGFLHYYHHAKEELHHTIPIVENFLFALALLRSKTVDHINEAKDLLAKLLHFQNRLNDLNEEGNFPFYLHEFPLCKDRSVSLHVAMALYYILKQFHSVLGQDLKTKLEEALVRSLQHTSRWQSEKSGSYLLSLKCAALSQASGKLLSLSDLETYGKNQLEQLTHQPDHLSWHSPAALGQIYTALSLVYEDLNQSPWNHFWGHLIHTWHAPTCTYMGPAIKEWQDGYEPQVTLYDLIMGYLSGSFSKRSLQEAPAHLEAVLILPSRAEFLPNINQPLSIKGNFDNASWNLYQNHSIAYSTVTSQDIKNDKGFQPLRIIWGNSNRTHTLSVQGSQHVTFEHLLDRLHLFFELNGPPDCEDREKSRELIFFIDAPESWQFFVDGQKASTFRIEDTLSFHSDSKQFFLNFSLEEGSGNFSGHCMLGNRPSQLAIKGKQRFDAFDWQLFLRTLTRTDSCRIKATLRWEQ